MKKFIFTTIFLLSASCFAQPNTSLKQDASIDAENKLRIDIVFPQRKATALQVIADREKILAQEKVCVTGAKNTEQLKYCFIAANQDRKQMGNELKAKYPNPKENKEVKK